MIADHGTSGEDDRDVELTHQAWQEARDEVERDCWIGILKKCSDVKRHWRLCLVEACRRQHRCSDARLVCLETAGRLSPPVEMTPAERAHMQYELKQALQQEIAKREARGETSDLGDRIARLAKRKRETLRAAQSRGG